MEDIERTVGQLEGNVKDLLRWRDVFEQDIKDSLGKLDTKIENEMRDVNQSLRSIEQKVDTGMNEQSKMLQQALKHVPGWVPIVCGGILTVAGWFVAWATYHH